MPHPLDSRIRTAHAVANIRGSLMRSPDGPHADRPNEHAGTATVLTLPIPAPVRDGVRRTGALAPTDNQGRVHLRKATTALGWEPGTRLVARVDGRSAVVRPGERKSPLDTPVTADREGRLALPPVVVAALDLHPGDQVLAIAVPATGQLRLHAAADALQELTGPLSVPPPTLQDIAPRRKTGTRVKPRFTPDPAGA